MQFNLHTEKYTFKYLLKKFLCYDLCLSITMFFFLKSILCEKLYGLDLIYKKLQAGNSGIIEIVLVQR